MNGWLHDPEQINSECVETMAVKFKQVPAQVQVDRRVGRTRARFSTSLHELMRRKPIAQITVQEIIEHARVSRSAFYAHYTDKVDLLVTDLDRFLQYVATYLSRTGERSERLLPVVELLSHVREAHEIPAALGRSGFMQDFLELAREHFARGIERRLQELPRAHGLHPLQRSALGQALAGAFVAQLDWWLRARQPLSPEQMDRDFHQLAWSGIPAIEPVKCNGKSLRSS